MCLFCPGLTPVRAATLAPNIEVTSENADVRRHVTDRAGHARSVVRRDSGKSRSNSDRRHGSDHRRKDRRRRKRSPSPSYSRSRSRSESGSCYTVSTGSPSRSRTREREVSRKRDKTPPLSSTPHPGRRDSASRKHPLGKHKTTKYFVSVSTLFCLRTNFVFSHFWETWPSGR